MIPIPPLPVAVGDAKLVLPPAAPAPPPPPPGFGPPVALPPLFP